MESSKTFIEEFCESLLEQYGIQGLKDLVIVIPSQRVALHIRETLLNLAETTFWMPKILPINQFLQELHDFAVIDEVELVFELYQAYVESFDEPESFDDFLSWSSMIISDFNEIDKYLLDANLVFKNLQSIKDIESWSFNSEELSATQKNFMKFWEQLGVLYQNLHQRLSEKGEITNAKVYRNIAEEPEGYLASIKERVFFIGFNALSKAEEKIIKFIVSAKIGEVIWDEDEYYVGNSLMEAGQFIRRYRSWSSQGSRITRDHLKTKRKEINLYKANSNLQQTAIASELMREMGRSTASSGAVVFADETLLKPMLNVLPKDTLKLNVAMGYPLNTASVFSFFEDLVQVQVNIDRHKNKGFIYHKDFLRITQHELINSYANEIGIDFSRLNNKISKENYAYLPLDLIKEEFRNSDILFMFMKCDEVSIFLSGVVKFFESIYTILGGDIIEREALAGLVGALQKLLEIHERYFVIKQVTTLNQIVRQILRGLKVSFLGEPLEGVQFLGLLETRALDFDHVVLLSCNEDVLPKRSFSSSLIPYDLRGYLGLPSQDDRDAIFAYYFYRLIQRSSRVDLIYNGGASDGLQANEISRYLLQIEEELKGESVEINHVHPQAEVNHSDDSQSDNEAGLLTKERVLEWFQNGISASGMNQFNTCPRNFLFTQLMRFSQDEEIEEDIELSTYGTIVHEVLENLYKEAGELIGDKELKNMLSNYKSYVNESFSKRFPGGNYRAGKNLLMYETALYTIQKFLKSEVEIVKKNGVIRILGLEKAFERELVLHTSMGEIPVKIKGLIDRVDQVGGQVRIIDYKTGKVEDLNFKGDWSRVTKFQLQLMVYLYLFDTDANLTSGMVSFKALSKGFQPLSMSKATVFERDWIKNEFEGKFEEYLLDFAEAVLNSSFEHDAKSKYCVFC